MQCLKNSYRKKGINASPKLQGKYTSIDAQKVLDLLKFCPKYQETPIIKAEKLAQLFSVKNIFLKDERERMGLGSFKALGAAYVIACDAYKKIKDQQLTADQLNLEQLKELLKDKTYVCSSAGNHGLSIAAGARIFGAQAVIYLSVNVPESFAQRLTNFGAKVVRFGDNYEVGLFEAMRVAKENNWVLLSDTSWQEYTEIPTLLMEGYLAMANEIQQQIHTLKQTPPSHLFLQAGVGGMAGAVCGYLRHQWGDKVTIIVVEPEKAPALYESVEQGKVIITTGGVSNMGRLDCKEPSHVALNTLSKDADFFITISDEQADQTLNKLKEHNLNASPTAVAGISVVHHLQKNSAIKETLRINSDSDILCILTEQEA